MKDRSVDLSVFTKGQIPNVPNAWDEFYGKRYTKKHKDYTLEEINTVLNSGSLDDKQILSVNYFEKDGLYTRLLFYYATVLDYNGLLIPNPSYGKSLTLPHIQKRYHGALEYLDRIQLQNYFPRFSLKALIYGCYYGALTTLDKQSLVIIDLPVPFCRSRFKDTCGNDIVEFDVSYFDTIIGDSARRDALQTYPKVISSHYKKWINSKTTTKWVKLPSEMGICFSFTETGTPLFVNVLPTILQYEQAVDQAQEKEAEEIKKIIVQKIPHIAGSGELVFEPTEALEMHKGAVNMLKGNKNISVLTTYADVESIVSKTSADTVNSTLEQMRQNVYSTAGASPQVFAPTGSSSLSTSIKNDIALMMILANKYANFVSYIVNTLFGHSNVYFTYLMLPVGIYNAIEYSDQADKLAQKGYPALLSMVAMGINQHQLMSLKELENDVLQLQDVLIPLNATYNQSAQQSSDKVGRPELTIEQKSQKTIQNEESIDHQGGA